MRLRPIRIGTRGSALAMVQAELVARAFAAEGREHRIVVVETAGDRRAPDTAWGEGAFVTAIEEALLDGRVDVAVHSAKDVPTDENPRLRIVACLRRADPRDALVVRPDVSAGRRTLATLPVRASVGTDSPRRAAFIRALRPDLVVRPLHGNVDTRLRRLDSGEVDALVLAVAGLERLGRADRIDEVLDPASVPPAPGQGAIAVQVRSADAPLLALGAAIDHLPTSLAVRAERSFLRASGGGCRAPIGALAAIDGRRVRLAAGVASEDGSTTRFDAAEGDAAEPEALGAALAERMAAADLRGADAPAATNAGLAAAAGAPGDRPAIRVLVTRAADQAATLVRSLADESIEAVCVPAIAIEDADPDRLLDAALASIGPGDWIVATSANGARAIASALARSGVDPRGVRAAAVGDATARVLVDAGVPAPWRPSRADGRTLGRELPIDGAQRIVWARGSLADGALVAALRFRGAGIEEVVVYRTVEGPAHGRPILERALRDHPPLAAVVFASGSAVRGLLALVDDDLRAAVLRLPAVCIGPRTAAIAEAAGFRVAAGADDRDVDALAEATARLVRQPVIGAVP